MGRLDGRVAIVTGGGRGLGRAIGLAFAAESARVAVAGSSARDLHAVVAEVEKFGASALAVTTDVTDKTSVRALVDGVVAVTRGRAVTRREEPGPRGAMTENGSCLRSEGSGPKEPSRRDRAHP